MYFFKNYKFGVYFFLLIILSSCSILHEDMSKVDSLLANKDYLSAIKELDSMESKYAKEKNSKAHLDYAINIIKDISKDQKSRYEMALELLEKSSSLDPKNQEAKKYYLMVLKLLKSV